LELPATGPRQLSANVVREKAARLQVLNLQLYESSPHEGTSFRRDLSPH